MDEAKFLLEPLFNNRSAVRDNYGYLMMIDVYRHQVDGSVTAWQEIETVVSHLKLLGIKETVSSTIYHY